jgi:hypothetical protein
MGRAYTDMGAMRNTCRILIGKVDVKRLLGIRKCRWYYYFSWKQDVSGLVLSGRGISGGAVVSNN